ncbi:MAG: PRC-barrel domain containing protein [Rubrivivax sp.]|nr:MAG: PRC-barrel domain containing protein [Rubrivivax sp.]
MQAETLIPSASTEGARIVINNSGPGPRLMTADTLTGNKVVNQQNETLGTVQDIMLDVPRGRIAYLVMSSGGFLGLGDRLFAIPWSVLVLDTDRKCFVLDARKSTFENAPGFDKNHWPSLADEDDWHQRVHGHFNADPDWDGKR